MFRRSRVAWKVSGLFSAITALVLAGTVYVNSLDDRREALASARDVSRMYSETILHSLHRFMATRDIDGIKSLIERLARDNPVYEDILLVSREGRIVTSFKGTEDRVVPLDELPLTGEDGLDQIVQKEDGWKTLSVITPIPNEESCRTAACHVHTDQGSPLGYLKTEYSLQRVDALVARHSYKTGIAVLVGILLCTVASWMAIQRLVGARLRVLTEGVRRVTEDDLDFRFSEGANDEFGELASAFNRMIRQLKRTREYLEGIVEDSADIIITVDPAGIIRKFNTGAERILGYARDEVIGKRIEMLFAEPSERDAAIARLEYTDHVVNYQTHFLTKDGRVRDVILTLSKLRRRDGTPIGTYGISKDVTREKRLLRQLVQSEKMAALGQAVTGIQHSVKNLLNVLKGGSYMVKTGLAKDDRELLNEGWQMVQDGIAHMTEFSTNMLQFAREQKLKTSETDLVGLVRNVHALSEGRFREEGVTLILDLADGLPFVQCDRELIHSVIMDLLSNALDACSWKEYNEGDVAQVTLRLQPASKEYVRIEVSDNGEGMTEEVRHKIFTPFFSTKKKKGTGMGLAIASRVVASHAGRITVASELGKGATFQVLLPVNGPSQEQEEYNVEESVGR